MRWSLSRTKKLDEHSVGAGGEVAFGHFGNLFDFRHYLGVYGTALQVHTYICAGEVTQGLGIDSVARAGDYTVLDHALNALVHCRTRYAAYQSHILRGDAGVVHHNRKDFTVKVVD